MSEDVVERIVDKDSKGKKLFFLLFFMLFPLSGVLLFWFDGHARIEKEAVKFAQEVVIPEMKSGSDLIEISTPEMGDRLRAGEFDWIAEDLGNLKSFERLDADQSRAREEDDRGVIYAEIDFTGVYEKGTARVHLQIKRLSLNDDRGATEEERKSTNDDWMIESMALQVKK